MMREKELNDQAEKLFPSRSPILIQPGEENEEEDAVKRDPGIKYDKDKLQFSLLPIEPLNEIIRVLMHPIKTGKYKPFNWQKLPDARNRYYDAAYRHLTAWYLGENADPDSGLHHLGHCACNIIFLLWFELVKKGRYPK